MAYYIVQGATTLYHVSTAGAVTALTLPTGITLRAQRSRFAQLATNLVMIGSPIRGLWIDENLTVRTQSLRPPTYAPILSAASGGTLNGTFKVRVSFYVFDADNNVILESPLGPESVASATLATQALKCQAIPTSDEGLANTGRRLYRTTTGPGAIYYPWLDLADNTTLTAIDDLSDAAMNILPAPITLINPPGTSINDDAVLIAVWKNRVFMRGTKMIDLVYFSEDGSFYQFADGNDLSIPPLNQDARGVTAFIARRDELGIMKRNVFWKLAGSSPDNWSLIKVAEQIGCVSQDTVVIIRDVAYWLGEDGVYKWGPDGVINIARERVHPWFTTDDTFNRAAFANAFATYNPLLDTLELFLPATGGTTINRWVSYSITRQTWMGPHLTSAFTPSYVFLADNAETQLVPMVGGTNGILYPMNRATALDASTAIDFDVDLAATAMELPDDIKLFGELGARARVETGGTLTITPYVGDLGASAGATIAFNLTTGRLRARILGSGRFVKLNFRNATASVKVRLYGCEIPFHSIGRD